MILKEFFEKVGFDNIQQKTTIHSDHSKYNCTTIYTLLALCIMCYFSCFFVVCWFFQNTIRVSNGLNPDQDRHLSVLIWVQTVCKGYQQITNVASGRVKYSHSYKHTQSTFMCGYVLLLTHLSIHKTFSPLQPLGQVNLNFLKVENKIFFQIV